jgi:CRISPR/Cas system-associated exonuclease Cas4 (RecB family)
MYMVIDGIKTISDASSEIVQAIVHELKPKNPRAIARGLKQLEEYVPEVRRMLGIDNVRGVILKYQGLPH